MNALARQNSFPSLIEHLRFGGPIGRDMNEFFSQNMPMSSNVPAVNVVEHADGFRRNGVAMKLLKPLTNPC